MSIGPESAVRRLPADIVLAMPTDAIGLDIGGANLKAATARPAASRCRSSCGSNPDNLPTSSRGFGGEVSDAEELAVTMTGELCDCFETKRDGVRHILAAVD